MRMRIRIRIWDKHPGSATLHTNMCRYENQINCGLDSVVGPICVVIYSKPVVGTVIYWILIHIKGYCLYQVQETAIYCIA